MKRPLAPGNQAAQGAVQGMAARLIGVPVEGKAVQQLDLAGREGRQSFDGAIPARQVAVADGQFAVDLRRQVGAPVLQRGA